VRRRIPGSLRPDEGAHLGVNSEGFGAGGTRFHVDTDRFGRACREAVPIQIAEMFPSLRAVHHIPPPTYFA
jgi:hypothetical protein